MNKITEKTNLYEYPLLILKFVEKYAGTKVPMNIERCNEIWNSLTDEEKATNKDYTIEKDDNRNLIIKKNGVIVGTFASGVFIVKG